MPTISWERVGDTSDDPMAEGNEGRDGARRLRRRPRASRRCAHALPLAPCFFISFGRPLVRFFRALGSLPRVADRTARHTSLAGRDVGGGRRR